jgi:hypothetical protein
MASPKFDIAITPFHAFVTLAGNKTASSRPTPQISRHRSDYVVSVSCRTRYDVAILLGFRAAIICPLIQAGGQRGRGFRKPLGEDLFPYFLPMDRDICFGLKPELYLATVDFKHGDSYAIAQAVCASDDHGLVVLS